MNKKLNKVLCQLLCLAMICMTILPTASAAGGVLKVECAKEQIQPGERFDVTVSVEASQPMAGCLIYLYGDTDAFTAATDSGSGAVLVKNGSLTQSGMLLSNTYEDKGWQTVWFHAEDVSGSGSLFTLTLIANKQITDGAYTFAVGYSPENTVNVANQQVSFTTVSDTLTVGEEAAAEEPEDYLDVPRSHWAYEPIMNLSRRGIVSGGGNGYFYPDNQVTRAEFVKMLAGVAGAETQGLTTGRFDDVKPGDWFMPYVAWASEAGIVTGISEDLFAPHALLTREQMAVLLVRLCEYRGIELSQSQVPMTFADGAAIQNYAKSAVGIVQQAGIISGYPDGTFRPAANTRRCEAAKVLSEILSLQ